MTRFQLRIAVSAARSVGDQAKSYGTAQLQARWETAVSDAIQSLRYSPERGALCGYLDPRLANLRRVPIRGFPFHLVFYQVLANDYIVRVVDVVDGRRDLERLLGA